jgi:hypothetical protein
MVVLRIWVWAWAWGRGMGMDNIICLFSNMIVTLEHGPSLVAAATFSQ